MCRPVSLTSASDHHSSSLAGSVPLKKSTTACSLVIRKALVSGISLAATCRGLQNDADCTGCWEFADSASVGEGGEWGLAYIEDDRT